MCKGDGYLCGPALWERSYRKSAGLATLLPGWRTHHRPRDTCKGTAMKYPVLMRTAAFAAVLAAGGVLAQTAPSAPDAAVGSPVISDVGPPPAHERNSLGAIVLEDSPVRAQRDRDFEKSRVGDTLPARKIKRAEARARVKSDLQRARELEAVEFYQRGAGATTPK
jgi:hypothetical protein